MEPHYQASAGSNNQPYPAPVYASWPYGQTNGEQPPYYYPQPEHYAQPATGVPVHDPNATYSYQSKDPHAALHPSYADSQSTLPPGVAPSTASAATWYQTQTAQAEQAQQQQQQLVQANAHYYAQYPYYTQQQQQQQQQPHPYPDQHTTYPQSQPAYYSSVQPSYHPSVSTQPSSTYITPYAPPQQDSYPTGYAVADQAVIATGAPAAAGYYQTYPTYKTEQQPEQQQEQPAHVTTGTYANTNTSTASDRHTSSAPEASLQPTDTHDLTPTSKTDDVASKPNPKSRTTTSSNKPAYVSVATKKKAKKPTVDDAFDRVGRSTSPAAPAAPAARRKTPPKSPPPKPKSDSPRSEWPESLKAYVSRAFSSCEDQNRDAVERELHSIVNTAITSGTMWKTDWETKKLPNACTKTKRKRDVAAAKTQSIEERTSLIHIDDDANGEQAKRDKRLRRFQEEFSRACTPTKTEPIVSVCNDVIDWDHHTIIGTCSKLEKQYLRLTSAPDSTTVRPLHILKKTLELLLTKWEAERNYTYICDQFKSMRQDLTVQRIKNDFTVKVYETHAKIAIQKADLGEYNQCQAQLKLLYEYDLPGEVMEFTAYRILYLLHTRNRSEINATMRELRKEQKEHPYVQHALAVRSALANGDYHSFFKLYRQAPLLGSHLIDCFLDRERVAAMMIICKGYKVTVEVAFVATELGFTEQTDCYKFLNQYNTTYQDPKTRQFIDCKASLVAWSDAMKSFEKVDIKGQL